MKTLAAFALGLLLTATAALAQVPPVTILPSGGSGAGGNASVGNFLEANCALATSGASISFTSASPTVGTWSGSPWSGTGTYSCPMNITANAPTGLSTATNYWVVPIDATTFHVATSPANAIAGTFANTSGTSTTANLTTDTLLTSTAGLSGAVLSVTAGDWDCSGSSIYVPVAATSITNLQQGIGTSATAIGALGTYSDWETAANVVTATNKPVLVTPIVRVSISATTTYNQVNLATFTADVLAATSDLRCRRLR